MVYFKKTKKPTKICPSEHRHYKIMLKSTITPILSTLPITKLTTPNLRGIITKSFCNTPSTVRPNASYKTISTTPSLHLPPTSAYIHLPFCRKRCHYCDFPIVALGSSSPHIEDDPRIINYIELICREINATDNSFETNLPLKTVFFGGGTPSLVPPKLVSRILEVLKLKYGLCLNAEISMEMDPGTFDGKKMDELMELGVNRVSLGVQAFQEELLKACGRAHGLKEAYEAIEIVKSCGVENWSMDLISSLPHQRVDMWEESLNLAIEAQPNHVSVYDLQVEQGTKFAALYTPGEFPLPSETISADFYKIASKTLADAGYEHYEISSYCKAGFECKHNLTYWINKPFYAFGLGSASYVNGIRFSRPKKMKEFMGYVQNLENGSSNDQNDNKSVDYSHKDRAMDIVMLSLRTSRGLDLMSFREAFGDSIVQSLCEAYKMYVESGHVVCLDSQRNVISIDEVSLIIKDEQKLKEVVSFVRLSDPDGFLLSNELISIAFGVLSP